MSAENNDGGPAFPVCFDHGECVSEQEGMTLRDYFASKALSGLLEFEYLRRAPGAICEDAYRIADAMLAERSKR